MDPNALFIFISLIPLLFIVLIFLTYLNFVEIRKGREMEDKLNQVAEGLELIAEKLESK